MVEKSLKFPFASNEVDRLREVRKVVGSGRDIDPFLQTVVDRVNSIFDSPIALVSVVESDHQWFLSKVGIDLDATPRDYSICSQTIMSDQPLVAPDTTNHRELMKHPAVVLEPHVRFYAGAPIILSSGFRVGSLCAVDVKAHQAPTAEMIDELVELAALVARHLEEIQARRKAEDEKGGGVSASEAQREFLSLVGHELRTPLTILLGNAKLMLPRMPGDTERRMSEAIIASGEHLNQIIKRILQYSDLESGELPLAEENINCLGLLDSAVVPVKPLANAFSRTIDTSCGKEVATIRADGEQLCLALSALTTNAVHHGKGAVIVNATRGRDRSLSLKVYDQGIGLPEDQLEKADRPFSIGGNLNTREKGGVGLGLPLAKKIAHLHGGTLASGEENKFSFVEIRLPSYRCVPPIQ